jgi:hypothetical protein
LPACASGAGHFGVKFFRHAARNPHTAFFIHPKNVFQGFSGLPLVFATKGKKTSIVLHLKTKAKVFA